MDHRTFASRAKDSFGWLFPWRFLVKEKMACFFFTLMRTSCLVVLDCRLNVKSEMQ